MSIPSMPETTRNEIARMIEDRRVADAALQQQYGAAWFHHALSGGYKEEIVASSPYYK